MRDIIWASEGVKKYLLKQGFPDNDRQIYDFTRDFLISIGESYQKYSKNYKGNIHAWRKNCVKVQENFSKFVQYTKKNLV